MEKSHLPTERYATDLRSTDLYLCRVFALVDAEDVAAVLDGRLVGVHQEEEGEAQKLLFVLVFGCKKTEHH